MPTVLKSWLSEMEQAERRGSLIFAVNGERFELSSIDPSTTLLEFLRCHTRFKSVKLGCGEGGCGACVVLLSKYDPASDKVEDFSASSCLTYLCSINGFSITTSEGLGNSKKGFHSIHQRFAGFHASQCGFCTPGMCVSLQAALISAEKTDRPEPPAGFSKLTVSEAERAIAGNLCRCTGYRPIVDACKTFAADVDIEDLGINSFWEKEDTKDVKIKKLPMLDRRSGLSSFPAFLKEQVKKSIDLGTEGCRWYNPVNLNELQTILRSNDSNDQSTIKLVSGNTAMGYYKDSESFDKFINLNNIPDLEVIKTDQTGIEIGSCVTISNAIAALRNCKKRKNCTEGKSVFGKIADHLEKIASGFVRNTASVGGNLVMAQRRNFPSDIATILLVVGSTVYLLTPSGREKLTFEEFMNQPPIDSETILLSVQIPNWDSSKNDSVLYNDLIMFETHRAAPRPLGNALPYLNAAFMAEVSPDQSRINSCNLAFGVFGTKRPIRARKVEEFLTGKTINAGVLYESIELLKASVVPEEGTSFPSYRTSVAIGYLFEFFSPLIDNKSKNSRFNEFRSILSMKNGDSDVNYKQSFLNRVPTVLSSAKQVVQLSTKYYPVGKPISKALSAIQASGEAVFVDDIPAPKNCLHGAIIYSTKPLARVNGVTFGPNPNPDGVVDVISFKDIPEGGKNVGSYTMFGFDPLFAEEVTQAAGEPIGFVVADTQKQANAAAKSAIIDYGFENLESPILSVEDAVNQSSFIEVPSFMYPKQVGDISRGMEEADQKILSAQVMLGSQYYFYLETQTALTVPDEDNSMVVYSSIQCPEAAHSTIAKCLGIPEHNVRVITRRVGGGFGGKALKATHIATACALAAYKLQRPVRIYINRKTDMIIAGGRHPMKITFSVGFKTTGKITALDLSILVDAGMSNDISPIMPHNIITALKKYDWGALSFDVKVCKTNRVSKSAMRGPGEVQGSFIAEAVIEHVASTLAMEVDSVREINLHGYDSLGLFYGNSRGELAEYSLPLIWDRLAVSLSLKQRVEIVNEFNTLNTWRKRGLSRVPIVHEVQLFPTPGKVSILPDGSVVVEVGGIELGQGLWTKVKQMTAYALSSIGCAETGQLLDKVRVIQADSLSLTQGGFTSGSTTSESSCEAVRLCCNILVERLNPVRQTLEQQTSPVEWNTLIRQAHMEAVNLSVNSLFVPQLDWRKYLNYGAAVSEVEVNVLTGETRILRSDIIYDCGQSLNPAVDFGQIEGAFVQGIGFFMLEEYLTNSDGLVVNEGTWDYKIPTVDTLPKEFNVEIMNSGHHQNRVLSSKASGEPPLLLAASVHCATRAAIKAAREQVLSWRREEGRDSMFQLQVPAILPAVKELCGLDSVERYLEWRLASSNGHP